MKNKYLTITALLIAIIALCFSLFRIIPFTFGSDAYIGIIATFIGISVTLLVGYQIINTLEIRSELKQLSVKSTEVEEAKKHIIQLENEAQEAFDLIAAKLHSKVQDECVLAVIMQHKALISSLKSGRTNYDGIFHDFKHYITGMEPGYFATGTNTEIERKIDEYKKTINEDASIIKNQTNYFIIKYEYERIIKNLEIRFEKARKGETVSVDEIREIMR